MSSKFRHSLTWEEVGLNFHVGLSSVGTIFIRLESGDGHYILWENEFDKLIQEVIPQISEGVKTDVFNEMGHLEYDLSKSRRVGAKKDFQERSVDYFFVEIAKAGGNDKELLLSQDQWDRFVQDKEACLYVVQKAKENLGGSKKRKLTEPVRHMGNGSLFRFVISEGGKVIYKDATFYQKKPQCAAAGAVKCKSMSPDAVSEVMTYRVKKRSGAILMCDIVKMLRQKSSEKIKPDRMATLFEMCHNEILRWGMNPYGPPMAEMASLLITEVPDEWRPDRDEEDDYGDFLREWITHMMTFLKIKQRKMKL